MVILPRGSELVARGGEVVAGDVALTVARESTTEVDVFIAVGEGGLEKVSLQWVKELQKMSLQKQVTEVMEKVSFHPLPTEEHLKHARRASQQPSPEC